MLDLFRSFERHGVDYLLIGGQATILYGASQFTEDVDFWVRPTSESISRSRSSGSRIWARRAIVCI